MRSQQNEVMALIDPFPHLHVRPARGWVNDPNGIGWWDGRWHVMYQWNPDAPLHRNVHWGHMSSADLLSWRDEGVALRPRPGSIDAAGVWSGVAVREGEGVALVYTAVPDHARHAGVAVARQAGDGAWAQPPGTATEHPDHDRWREVRDPFVVSVGGRRLGIMGAGRADSDTARRAGRGAALVYDADDLDHWTLLGPLLVADDLADEMVGPGAIWECPQLVPVGDRWLLVVSWDDGGGLPTPGPDGNLVRHQGVIAYVGSLDLSGPVPRFQAATETVLDHGPDFYAPQLVADGERVLAWGWAWEGRGYGTNHRSNDEIAASGWAGTLTFPREVVIDATGAARCIPARELAGLVGEPLAGTRVEGGWEVLTNAPAWMLAAESGVEVHLLDEATGHSRAVWGADAPGPTHVYVDGSIVEVFDGSGSTTLRAYPAEGERWRVRSADPLEAATLRVR